MNKKLTHEDRCQALLNHASYDRQSRASAVLLLSHGAWLRRADFLTHTSYHFNGGHPWLVVDWPSLNDAFSKGELVCSHTEYIVLEIVLSLMGQRTADLSQLAGLGRTARCVSSAVLTAAGEDDRG